MAPPVFTGVIVSHEIATTETAVGLGPATGRTDLSKIGHHCEGGVACSERDLRKTHKHQSEDSCEGV
jgi:hypothetical protein